MFITVFDRTKHGPGQISSFSVCENFSYKVVAFYEFLLTVLYLITIMQPIFKQVFSPRLAQDFFNP